jgi:diguanylate cyclase (GGDEF)-like protein
VIAATVVGAIFSARFPAAISDRYFNSLCTSLIGSNLILPLRFRHAALVTVLGMASVLLLYPYSPERAGLRVFLFPSILLGISLVLRLRQERLERRAWLAEFQNQLQTNTLESLVNIDALTGISNRRYFDTSLRQMWLQAEQQKLPLSLVMMDVDHFKAFNDYFGHMEGDNGLALIGQTLEGQLRGGVDVLARYGGDEFCVLLPGASEETVLQIAERLRAAVEELKIGSSAPQRPLTLTIGAACYEPQRSQTAEWMLPEAINSSHLLAAADGGLRYRVTVAVSIPANQMHPFLQKPCAIIGVRRGWLRLCRGGLSGLSGIGCARWLLAGAGGSGLGCVCFDEGSRLGEMLAGILLRVEQRVHLLRRKDIGRRAAMSCNHDSLPLGGIEQEAKVVLRFYGGHLEHGFPSK